jgi:hypothetical protein
MPPGFDAAPRTIIGPSHLPRPRPRHPSIVRLGVEIADDPSAASDEAVRRFFEAFLSSERPGTSWRVHVLTRT